MVVRFGVPTTGLGQCRPEKGSLSGGRSSPKTGRPDGAENRPVQKRQMVWGFARALAARKLSICRHLGRGGEGGTFRRCRKRLVPAVVWRREPCRLCSNLASRGPAAFAGRDRRSSGRVQGSGLVNFTEQTRAVRQPSWRAWEQRHGHIHVEQPIPSGRGSRR